MISRVSPDWYEKSMRKWGICSEFWILGFVKIQELAVEEVSLSMFAEAMMKDIGRMGTQSVFFGMEDVIPARLIPIGENLAMKENQ